MSQKKIDQVIGDKGFRFLDLVVYFCLLAMVAAFFFLASVLSNYPNTFEGIQVLCYGERGFEYRFESDQYLISDENRIHILSNDREYMEIAIETDHDGYNRLVIDKTDCSVFMADANCSWRKDCTHMQPLRGKGSIFCMPHSVLVLPIGPFDDGTIQG